MGASIRQVVLIWKGHCNTNLTSYSVGDGFIRQQAFIWEGLSIRSFNFCLCFQNSSVQIFMIQCVSSGPLCPAPIMTHLLQISLTRSSLQNTSRPTLLLEEGILHCLEQGGCTPGLPVLKSWCLVLLMQDSLTNWNSLMTVEEGRLNKDESKPLFVWFKLSNNIKYKCGLWV